MVIVVVILRQREGEKTIKVMPVIVRPATTPSPGVLYQLHLLTDPFKRLWRNTREKPCKNAKQYIERNIAIIKWLLQGKV